MEQRSRTLEILKAHSMKCLVTGGAGFIGSNLVDELIHSGHEVTVVDNESAETNEEFYWNPAAKNYKLDICDYESTKSLYNGVDYVFHVAADARIQPSIHNPLQAVKNNTLGTCTVLQCSKEAGVRRVVYSSTSSAYGMNTPPNEESQPDHCMTVYSVSKVSGEKFCHLYTEIFGLETVTLRYFNVYGNRQPLKGKYAPVIGLFLKQNQAGLPLTIVGDGEQRRDFTNIADVVAANILAAVTPVDRNKLGQVYNVGTGNNYSINQIAAMITDRVEHIPPRIGEGRITLADNTKMRRVFGWEPKHQLKDYIAAALKDM
jgi:UDP-glucose 4-epimerase